MREREVSLCVCKNNLQYETRRNATRKVRRASASACTTDSAVTPAEAATAAAAAVAVTVAYGGRLLRFSFGQRKYKEIWKIRCVILYVCIVRFYEHTRVFFCFLFTFVSVFFYICQNASFAYNIDDECVACICICMYVCCAPTGLFATQNFLFHFLCAALAFCCFVITCFALLFLIMQCTFTFYLIIYTLRNELNIRLSLFIALIMHILRQLATFMPEFAVLLAKQ